MDHNPDTMTVLGLVTARGGSKGVPRKNVRVLAGRPLVAWTIAAARQSRLLDRVVMSTDDEAIAEVAREWGAQTPFLRPPELAGDDSPPIDAVMHALEWLVAHERYQPDYVMLLQPTSPLRTADDIDGAIVLARRQRADAVVGVCETHAHPQLCRRLDARGRLLPFAEADVAYARRQDLPPAYVLNGAIYLNCCEPLKRTRRFEPPSGALGYVMPPERSLQIDTEWDWRLVELVLRERGSAPDDRPDGGPDRGDRRSGR